MAFPTTEIAFLPFPAGSRLEDASSHEGSVYQAVVAKAISLKGFTRGYAGRQVEHPDTVQMLVGQWWPYTFPFFDSPKKTSRADIYKRLGCSEFAPHVRRKPRIHTFLHARPSHLGR